MRKLNVRFFVIVLVALIVTAGGLYLIHFFQQDRIAAAQLYQAQSCRNAGQIDKAAEHYERYLEFRPDDAAVMLAYGEMLEQQLEKQPLGARNARKVVYLFEEFLKRQADRDDIRRRLVALYMLPRMRRYKDAETHLDILQKKFPEDGTLWQQLAICQENTGQYEAAAETLTKSRRFPPDQVRNHELLARILRKYLGRTQQADEIIREMVEGYATSHEAHLARARYKIEFGLGDYSAEAAEAIRLAPDNAEAILLQARAFQQQRKASDAVALLERGLKLYPEDARFYRHIAWIEYFQKKHESARQRLQAGIIACPDAFELHTALAELLIVGKMFDQVEKILVELKSKGVREERINYLKARIAVERGQWPEAVVMLEKLMPEVRGHHDMSVQVNILLAHCHRHLGDNDRQLEALRRVLQLDAQNVHARSAMAALHVTANRLNEAIREYEQLVALPNAPAAAAVDMVRLMIARKMRTPSEQQSWADIERFLMAIEKRTPNSTDALLARSDLLLAQNKAAEAVKLLTAACAKSKDTRLWMQLAHCSELSAKTGLEVMDRATAVIGDHPDLRLKRAALMIGRSPIRYRRELTALETPPESFTEEQTVQFQTGLAELYFTVQEYIGSRRLFQRLAQERPGDLHARVMLVEIAMRENDREAIPPLLAELKQIEPPGGALAPMLETRYMLMLAEEGDRRAADRARELLRGLQQQRPSWPQVHQGLGRLAEVDGDKARAIDHLRQAVELGDTELRTHHRLIRLLVEAKRDTEAEQVLLTARKQGMLTVEKQRQVLSLVAPMLKSPVVQQFVQQSVVKDAADPDELVWLGKMMWDTGDRARAIEAFRSAVEKAGHVPDHWVTLVQALAADRKHDEAKAVMQQAREKLPPELAGRTVAQCLELLHQFDAALHEYSAALRNQPSDPILLRRFTRLCISLGRADDAVKVLNYLIDHPGTLAKEDIAWARRNLAILGTTERTPEQYERAFQLLKENEGSTGPSLEDMRAKVVLLAQQPPRAGESVSPRRRAIELLEKIVQHAQSTREDRFALAKLYDSEREWAKAEKQYRAVIAADPREPMPIAHLARRLLQQGMIPQAGELIAQIGRIMPESPLHINLRSRLQFLAGDTERLIADLTAYVGKDTATRDGAARAFLAGSLLDEFVRSSNNPRPNSRDRMRQTALAFYTSSIQHHPEAVVRMVALWSHTGQRDLAIKWLRDPKAKIPLNLQASAEIAALRSAHASEAECQAVEKMLREKAAKNKEVQLDLHLADLAELRHDFVAAERHLRIVLKNEPNNVVAMNNLAWVLAHRGPSPEALKLVHKALTLVGPIPELLDTRAKVYLAMGRPAEAAQDLEDALNDAPTAMRYFQLAVAREKCGNSAGAREAFVQAMQLGIDARDLHPADQPEFERFKKMKADFTAR